MGIMSFSNLKVVLVIALISHVKANAQELFRIQSDVDESSCLCGVNRGLLDTLENILRQSTTQCSSDSAQDQHTNSSNTLTDSALPEELFEPVTEAAHVSLQATGGGTSASGSGVHAVHEDKNVESPEETSNQLPELLLQMGGQMNKLSSGFNRIEMLLEKLVEKMSAPPESDSKPGTQAPVLPEKATPAPSEAVVKPNQTNRENESWFLNGLKPVAQTNEALMKLNQSTSVDPHTMEAALQSTVPNVVTNIFTNIDSLQNQIQKQPADAAGSLTSVDGSSSIELPKASSSAVIMSTGEKLLLLWIEKQFESLHVTASVANHLRKAALNLFRSIMKQYTDRMGQIGSNLGQNMKTVTQIALNNTQNLISFILRNYMNFAGGLMQIIGERVSFVGKQLDTTGDSIAHLPINPFVIFSNVMESLPNPSNYSKYFRAFGKQLLGDDEPVRQKVVQIPAASGESQVNAEQVATEPANKQAGIFSKTMGALSKTFGSILG